LAGANVSPIVLGAFAFLLGLGAIAVALRTRRRREKYPESYAASGGVFYTAVQVGCGAILLVGGLGIIVLALIFKR
jgi:hypothetical protein